MRPWTLNHCVDRGIEQVDSRCDIRQWVVGRHDGLTKHHMQPLPHCCVRLLRQSLVTKPVPSVVVEGTEAIGGSEGAGVGRTVEHKSTFCRLGAFRLIQLEVVRRSTRSSPSGFRSVIC